MSEPTFREVIKDEPFDLTVAALCFAREMAYPRLKIASYMEKFEQLADQALPFLNPKRTYPFQAAQLRDFLFDEEKYKMDYMGFKNPDNYYLNHLLDEKSSYNICLGIFFTEIARRLEIPIAWADVPGYPLLQVSSPKRIAHLSPTYHCRQTTIREISSNMRFENEYDGPFEKWMLEPVPEKRILTLLIEDLLHCFFMSKNYAEEVRAMKFLLMLEPDNPAYFRRYATLLDLSGSKRKALDMYEEYFTRFPYEEENDDFRVNFWLAAQVIARRN